MNEIASFVLKGKISSDTQIRNVLQVVPPPLNMFNWKTTFMQKGVVIDCYSTSRNLTTAQINTVRRYVVIAKLRTFVCFKHQFDFPD